MKTDLDIDLLRSFVAVAETRHFTRAAERLDCVQSAVSMQIKRLEQVLDARLFDRTRRAVKLTGDGERLLRDARRILRINEEVLADFGRRRVAGRVRLGATDTSMGYLPPILAHFAAAYPLVALDVRCGRSWDALDDLAAGEIDLAFVTQPCGREPGQVVRREPLVWAAARASVADEQDPLPLAIFAPGCIYREAALDALDGAGRRWRHAYASPSRDGLMAAVNAGLAVTIAPRSLVGPDLRIIAPDRGLPPLPEIEIFLHRPQGDLAPPVETLADVIVEVLHSAEKSAASSPRQI